MRRAEQVGELRQRLERKTLVLDTLAHDLRSRLTAIAGFAETLQRVTDSRLSQDERDGLLERIAAGAQDISGLLRDALDLERADAGALQARRRSVNVGEVVRKALERFDTDDRPVTLTADDVDTIVDPFVVERIVENLVGNAVRHTPPGTPISLAARASASGLELTVTDKGPGVPTDARDAIFDRFFRAGDPQAVPGVGLGLSLVERLAELHGGAVRLEPEVQGAAFRVFLATNGNVPRPAHDHATGVAESTEARPEPESSASLAPDWGPIGVLRLEDSGEAIAVNRAWVEMTGSAASESTGRAWLRVFGLVDQARVLAQLAHLRPGGPPSWADYEIATPTGPRWTRWWASACGAASGGAVVAVADIDADRRREHELVEKATHDGLTGLVNRTQFLAFVTHALRTLERSPGHVAVIFIDLDDFKVVNDTSGHQAGDHVLAAVGERILSSVRPGDVAARLGGDEFAILCTDLHDPAEADLLATRLRRALEQPFEGDGESYVTGASTGIAVASSGHESAEALLARADSAMYSAKRSKRRIGRSQISPSGDAGASASPEATADRGTPSVHPVDVAGLAGVVIDRVFAAGLAIDAVAGHVDGPLAAKLIGAVEELDRVICHVRTTAAKLTG